MKNLKKILALVLAFACAFTMFAGAAFTDSADIKATEAVNMLSALGVINGYTDGSFKPNDTVTRAEMAKMIYVLRTGSDKATAYENATTKFTDVKGHWAAPYIKYCEAMGIIAGKSATKFAPDVTVTGEETAKMLLVTIGYDATKAGLVGTAWAQKSTALATENGLLEDVDASLGLALPRQWAAQMIYNAVDADTVSYNADGQVVKTEKTENATVPYKSSTTKKYDLVNSSDAVLATYDSYTDAKKALGDGVVAGATKIVSRDEDVYTYVQETKTKNETVGEKYLDLHTSVGLLMTSGNETLNSSFSSGDDVLKINNAKSESDINEGTKSSFTKVKTDYTALLGQRVKVLYKDTDEVIGVYPVDENKVAATVKASDLDTVSGSNNTKKIDVDGTKYTMDDDIVFYVNDNPVAGATSTARLAAFLNNAASNSDFEATVISNDDDDKIDVVRVNTKAFGKVTSATSSTIYYKGYTNGTAGAAVKVDTDDAKAYDGLKKDDYVFVHTDGFTGDVVFELATKVTGKTDSKKDDKLRIDGTWYNIKNAKASGDANNWKINSSYDVYVYGSYAYLVEGASGSDIDTMVVKSVGDIKRMDKGVEVKVLLEDGTEKVINVVKKIANNEDVESTGTPFGTDGVALQTALEGMKNTLVAYYEDDGDYTLQALPTSGAVKDIENKSTSTDFSVKTGAYNKDKATIAGLDVANDAVVYVSYNSGDDYKVVTGKQFMSYASVSNATVLYDTSDKDYVKVAFVKYTGTAASGDDLYGIVTSTYEAKNADNDTVTYFTVLTADGEKKDVESDSRYTAKSIIKKGSVVTFKGSYDKMEDVTAVAGQYGAVKAYNADTKRVSFYQGLTNTNTNASVTLDTAKITGDSVVMYVDQTGSDWTVVASGEPGEAHEYFDASNVVKGYNANVYALTNSDDEFDLLIVEVNNEIKDTTKDTIVLESGSTPISALTKGSNVKSVEQKGMNITITLNNGQATGTVTAKVAKAATVSSEDTDHYASASVNTADGTLTLNVKDVTTTASTFDITVKEAGQADLVYHVTVVQAQA